MDILLCIGLNPPVSAGDTKDAALISWVWKILWSRKWNFAPLFLPGNIPWTEEPPGELQSKGLQNWMKLVLEKAQEPEIKLPISAGSWKKLESSRKTSISALLTMPKPLTV